MKSQNGSPEESPNVEASARPSTPISKSPIASALERILNLKRFIATVLSMFQPKPYTFDERYKTVRYERLDDYPQGYPQLAAYLNLDPNFPVYRRFGTLRHRLMVHREVELMKLEQKLNEMDKIDSNEHQHRIQSIRKDHEDATKQGKETSEREELLNEVEVKLQRYDELLYREQKSQAMTRPSERNYYALLHYLWNEKAIVRSEIKFSDLKDDFVVLSPQQDSPFHALVEDLISKTRSSGLMRFFATPKQRDATNNRFIHLFSRTRINLLAQILITVIATAVFMIPISMLTLLDTSNPQKLGILLISILVFPVVIGPFSRPKHSELLAMTAAYAAVLVVFVGNITNISLSGSNSSIVKIGPN